MPFFNIKLTQLLLRFSIIKWLNYYLNSKMARICLKLMHFPRRNSLKLRNYKTTASKIFRNLLPTRVAQAEQSYKKLFKF